MSLERGLVVLDPMEVWNHEKGKGGCLRRQLSKLSLEVPRSVYCPSMQAPQTPYSSVVSVDSAQSNTNSSGHHSGHDHKPNLEVRRKEILQKVFKWKDSPIPGSSNSPPPILPEN